MGENKDFKRKVFYRDLSCGMVAGLVICIVGHPLDTMKVHMQQNQNNITNIVKAIWKNGVYRGVGPPLLYMPMEGAIVFSAYEMTKR